MERTLALIAPEIAGKPALVTKVLDVLDEEGFFICQKKELRFTRERAELFYIEHKGTNYFEDLIQYITDGTCLALEMSKVGAIQHFRKIMGPTNPEKAKNDAPESLRARFGTDVTRNGFHGSDSATGASRELKLVFPSPPMNQMGTKQYLAATVLPGVAEALTQLCRVRPADPYTWLATWLQSTRPRVGIFGDEYPEPVLKGHVMKADEFANIHREKELGSRKWPAVWNFRKSRGLLAVYGMGQSEENGIETVVDHLLEYGYSQGVCLNMREEPVVFIDGKPCSPRVRGKLNDNVDYLCGIAGFELERIERRLKHDIMDYCGSANDELEVFFQDADMSNHVRTMNVSKENIRTPRDYYDKLSFNGQPIQYMRIPITDETEPDNQAFDSIVEVMRDLDPHAFVLCNCQMGRGRTTTAMVCASLILRAKTNQGPGEFKPMNSEKPDYARAEFLPIRKFIEQIKDGESLKAQVDEVIDECDALQNLRSVSKMNGVFVKKKEL
eukprot:TRINITY_DN53972_c0_g1_i1.p1 TRINITY_DN53972_c0_g1~~TRINITY_DN53972_c0_g1_i1.p1  ORF type:complete len:499 (-),score=179.29 TRINITY_DN53972_c0_g1_i1:225-1721(-)